MFLMWCFFHVWRRQDMDFFLHEWKCAFYRHIGPSPTSHIMLSLLFWNIVQEFVNLLFIPFPFLLTCFVDVLNDFISYLCVFVHLCICKWKVHFGPGMSVHQFVSVSGLLSQRIDLNQVWKDSWFLPSSSFCWLLSPFLLPGLQKHVMNASSPAHIVIIV